MIEDIIDSYKNECTRAYQFPIALNPGIMLAIILSFSLILEKLFFPILNKFAPKLIQIDFYFLILFFIIAILVEIIYLSLVQMYTYHKEKNYIIKIFSDILSKEETDDTTKEEINQLLSQIIKSKFNRKYILDSSPVEKIFNKIKFDKFLEINKINTNKSSKKHAKKIKKYMKEKNNFKEYIDIALVGVIIVEVIKPIIEYAQNAYIPNTSSSFNLGNVVIYLVTIFVFSALFILINHHLGVFNILSIRKKKRLLFILTEKLNNYDFNVKKSERYLEEIESATK